jgi:hypothetical protein
MRTSSVESISSSLLAETAEEMFPEREIPAGEKQPTAVSSKVFHDPQSLHCPFHFGCSRPHSVHINRVLGGLIFGIIFYSFYFMLVAYTQVSQDSFVDCERDFLLIIGVVELCRFLGMGKEAALNQYRGLYGRFEQV